MGNTRTLLRLLHDNAAADTEARVTIQCLEGEQLQDKLRPTYNHDLCILAVFHFENWPCWNEFFCCEFKIVRVCVSCMCIVLSSLGYICILLALRASLGAL